MRFPLEKEAVDQSTDSIQSVLNAIESHYREEQEVEEAAAKEDEKSKGSHNAKTDENIVSDMFLPQQKQQQQHPHQPQPTQPGAVNVRGIYHNESDEEQGKYDNLNDAVSAEFRPATGVVQVQIVSQDALEREVMERFQQRSVVAQASSLAPDQGGRGVGSDSGKMSTLEEVSEEYSKFGSGKSSETRRCKRWMCIAIPVWIVIIIAMVGGLVGGIVASRQSNNSEASLTSPCFSPSLPPSLSPSFNVPDELLELYSVVQLHPDYPFPYDTSSYPYEALEWVQEQRNQNPDLTDQDIVEKYVAACIAFATKASETFEPQYFDNTKWLTDQPICQWMGFNCDHVELSLTNSTSTNITVLQGVTLGFSQIAANLPSELALLSNSLVQISFIQNQLNGTIPTEVGLLTKLQLLDLSSNDITGQIPSEIGLLTQLTRLELTDNCISGTFPDELSNIGSSLEGVYLGKNNLRGELSTEFFRRMTHLETFRVDNNRFEGPLPTEIGLMTKLVTLMLVRNGLGSSLPTELGLLSELRLLNGGANLLNGTVPSEIGEMTSLRSVYLERNLLTGTLPAGMFDRLLDLGRLDLNQNELSGFLPEALMDVPRLRDLYVGENNFVGSNPMCHKNTTAPPPPPQEGGGDRPPPPPGIIMADCLEVDCPCCTHCCEDIPICHRFQRSGPPP